MRFPAESRVDSHIQSSTGQKYKSANRALHELTVKIEKAISEREYVLALFMDIGGTLNYGSFVAICDAARYHKTDPLLLSWSFIFWSERISIYWSDGSLTRQGVLDAVHSEGFILLFYGS